MSELGAMFFVGFVSGITFGIALMWDWRTGVSAAPTEHGARPL